MRWRLLAGVGAMVAVVAATVAAVVIAIGSVSAPRDLDRIEAAIRSQSNCTDIAVRHPSRARTARAWVGVAAQSTDLVCQGSGTQLVYVKFADQDTLLRTAATTTSTDPYCEFGSSVLLNPTTGVASTFLSDVCQSVGGKIVVASS